MNIPVFSDMCSMELCLQIQSDLSVPEAPEGNDTGSGR